jgi:hypothetical protein
MREVSDLDLGYDAAAQVHAALGTPFDEEERT